MSHSLPRTLIVVLVVAVALVAMMASAALAATPVDAPTAGQSFGDHVSDMAQKGCLGTEHNPGMHQGITGWHGDECPAMGE